MQYQVISLKNAKNAVAREHAQALQELEAVKAKLNESGTEIAALRGQVERTEASLNSTRQQLLKTGEHANVKTAESSELAERLEQVMREADESKAEYEKEVAKGKDITARVEEAKKKIQELVSASVFPFVRINVSDVCGAFSYGSMEKKLQELEESRKSYNRLVDKNSEDVNELKTVSSEARTRMPFCRCPFRPEPDLFYLEITAFTAPRGNHELLSNAKTSIVELRDELSDGMRKLYPCSSINSRGLVHRVNDILRDKLFQVTAQLAGATTKVQELEQEKGDVWGRMIESITQNTDLQNSLISSGE